MKQLVASCLALTACGLYEENVGRTRDATARWATVLATREQEIARAAAVDSIGDVVAVGNQKQPSGQGAGFVTKRVASDGSERWTLKFQPQTSGSQADTMSVAIGPNDEAFVAGYIVGRVDVAGTTLDASNPTPADGFGGFVAKLSSTGHAEWVRGFDHFSVSSIATLSDGRSFIVGRFVGPLTVAGTVLGTSSTDDGAALIALDPNGVPLWARAFHSSSGADGTLSAESVTVAPNDDVLVVGQFYAATAFGGPVLSLPTGARGASFLTRFRSDGLYLASSVVPTPGYEMAVGTEVAMDPLGSTAILTWEQNPAEGNAVPAVHVLDDAQDQLWTSRVHGPFAFTADGAMLTAQWVDDRPAQTGALQLATVDATGFTWTTSLGSRIVNAPRGSGLRSAAAGPDGGVVLVGDLTGTINIADVELAAVGGQQDDIDALIILVDP